MLDHLNCSFRFFCTDHTASQCISLHLTATHFSYDSCCVDLLNYNICPFLILFDLMYNLNLIVNMKIYITVSSKTAGKGSR